MFTLAAPAVAVAIASTSTATVSMATVSTTTIVTDAAPSVASPVTGVDVPSCQDVTILAIANFSGSPPVGPELRVWIDAATDAFDQVGNVVECTIEGRPSSAEALLAGGWVDLVVEEAADDPNAAGRFPIPAAAAVLYAFIDQCPGDPMPAEQLRLRYEDEGVEVVAVVKTRTEDPPASVGCDGVLAPIGLSRVGTFFGYV